MEEEEILYYITKGFLPPIHSQVVVFNPENKEALLKLSKDIEWSFAIMAEAEGLHDSSHQVNYTPTNEIDSQRERQTRVNQNAIVATLSSYL